MDRIKTITASLKLSTYLREFDEDVNNALNEGYVLSQPIMTAGNTIVAVMIKKG